MSEPAATAAVSLLPSGWQFPVAPAETLLRAARQAGIVLPSACRNGTCRSCICRLVSGSVSYRIEWPGLSREEKAEGWILPCIATAAATSLVLEVPSARRIRE